MCVYIYMITPATNDKLSFQVPKLDVPTMYKVYKAYVRALEKDLPQNMVFDGMVPPL